MVSSLAPVPEERALACVAVSKNVDGGHGSTVQRSQRLRHMHPDVAEFLLLSSCSRRRRTKKRVPAAAKREEDGRARYDCAFEDEGAPEDGKDGFAPPRLVWVKVKTHPWWPAQVFDPTDASVLALWQRRTRGATLVACFWDRTFVWADAADLLPFRHGFPRLAGIGGKNQSTRMPAFASALDAALGEVARRVDAGLSCGCVADAGSKRQVFPNAGLRKGARGAAPDAAFPRDAFWGTAFVEYVSALAVAPMVGADRLDLTIAMSQLRAFNRWRGVGHGIEGIASMTTMEVAAPASRATARRRRARGGGDDASASAGKWRMSRCARGAAVVDAAFRGEALVEHISALAVAPPLAGANRRRDHTTTTAQLSRGLQEYTVSYDIEEDIANGAAAACHAIAKSGRSRGARDVADIADANARAGKWRMSRCSSRGRDSDEACENVDDYALEMEDFLPIQPHHPSHQVSKKMCNWVVGWKDYVIVMQFLLICALVCKVI